MATLGITDYAQQQLGDIVFVDLPKAGAQIEQGKELGTVESVKSVSELFAPVTGQVAEVNPAAARFAGEIESGSARRGVDAKGPIGQGGRVGRTSR
ncbi:MAG: hypothetical protein WDO18_15640 [Acidobacteriota bacterium]